MMRQQKIDDTFLTGKISVGHHPFVEHYKFVKALEDENTVAKTDDPGAGPVFRAAGNADEH